MKGKLEELLDKLIDRSSELGVNIAKINTPKLIELTKVVEGLKDEIMEMVSK